MKKKFLILGIAMSGLTMAQCDMKCDNFKKCNSNTINIEKCSDYPDGGLLIRMDRTQEYEFIHPKYVSLFKRVKTDKCCMSDCLLIIREAELDTVCMQHTPNIDHLEAIPELPHYYYNSPLTK